MDFEGPSSAPADPARAGRVARKMLLGLTPAAVAFSIWLLGLKLAATLTAGLLVHEFGHALVTWLYTRKVPPMLLVPPFFGLTFAMSMTGKSMQGDDEMT